MVIEWIFLRRTVCYISWGKHSIVNNPTLSWCIIECATMSVLMRFNRSSHRTDPFDLFVSDQTSMCVAAVSFSANSGTRVRRAVGAMPYISQ